MFVQSLKSLFSLRCIQPLHAIQSYLIFLKLKHVYACKRNFLFRLFAFLNITCNNMKSGQKLK